MRFLIALLSFTLITLVMSSPLPDKQNSNDKDSDKNGDSSSKSSSSSSSTSDKSNTSTQKQTNSTATASKEGASILSIQSFSDLDISDSKAGNAEQEAAAKFKGLDTGDLSKVSDADVKLIKNIHDTAEKAEKEDFNPALEKASGEEAKALQNGKIKNKVLKTSATVLELEIKKAKGEKVDEDELAKEKAKKAKNIKLDAAAKGQDSKSAKADNAV